MIYRASLSSILRGMIIDEKISKTLIGTPIRDETGEIVGHIEGVDFSKDEFFGTIDDNSQLAKRLKERESVGCSFSYDGDFRKGR